ncbi:MAG: hypothetical protein V7717_07265 [Porticoccaceae bacterium]
MLDIESFVTGEMSTRMAPVPEGEYSAVIVDVKARTVGVDKDKTLLEIYWEIQDGAMEETLGRLPRSRQFIFLDVTDEGLLDLSSGKNRGLGRLREALGQDGPGLFWSPNMLVGQMAIVQVEHHEYHGDFFAEVKTIAAIS